MKKVCNVWTKKVQKSYVSWHWKVMQNLKKNWLVVWTMTIVIWQIFTRALESLKIGTFMDPFIRSRKCMSLKFTEELCVMAMKNYAKFEEELTCRFKIDTKIWWILTRALECLKYLRFNELLLNKVYNTWANKVQNSYFWWHWRLMQNLKENWLVLSKIAWGIWQIFTGWKIAELNQDKNSNN